MQIHLRAIRRRTVSSISVQTSGSAAFTGSLKTSPNSMEPAPMVSDRALAGSE